MSTQRVDPKSPSLLSSLSRARSGKSQDLTYRHLSLYLDVAQNDQDYGLKLLGSSLSGLDQAEVDLRLEQNGPNEIVHEIKTEWPLQLFRTLKNPFILLLMVIGAISFATNDVAGGTIISTMVVVSVFLTFFQEFRSSRAAEKLRAMVSTTATVARKRQIDQLTPLEIETLKSAKIFHEFEKKEVPMSTIVPGDLVQLSAGDMIPADLRLLSSKDLFVSQSALTGEAMPVEKHSNTEPKTRRDLVEQQNVCFMGTNVISGTATGVVIKTGSQTYFGSLAKGIAGERVLTSFDKGINRFTALMLRFMMVMVPLVFVINGFAKHDWLEAFMFAVAVAVGLTPEMLPMIVTVNLAKGALAMSKKKVIVKRLNSIQNFGAMDVLCTDKTGTLTQDRVILEKYVDPEGNTSDRVLKYAYLNSFYQTGLKNLLDRAVLERGGATGPLQFDIEYKKIDEIPFDFSRRRMSVVVEGQGQQHELICKGALEEILSVSSQAEVEGKTVALTEELKGVMQQVAHLLNNDGLRVIAVGHKGMPGSQTEYSIKDESGLTLIGFIAFLDPPKETASQAIRALNLSGVTVKVLTGDSEVVTRKICKEVGLPFDRILLGHEVEAMTEEELAPLAESINVFAKLNPSQKQKIIMALHSRNHVVGFLGDGINDSPALKAADVGISVDNAVDIAKESADIILLEKNLLVLEEGVLEGRKVFGNIVKYIKMGASSNFGNMFSVLGASLFLPFLPMLPVQLLAQNLLYDLSQTAIPFDQVDEEYLQRPRRWEIGDIARFMFFIGPISSIFDYATFCLMWFVFHANTPAKQGLFQSGWFVEGLLSQTLIVHMIRTQKIPFIQSRASLPLTITTATVMIIGLCIPFSFFAEKLGMTPLPWQYFPWLLVFLVTYALLTQAVKTRFIRRYGFN